ncbi:hypothetical protein BDV26DRAFT_17705 [Aspergillus bertholletiae]|uniref:Uncharacterized protein n=1 Tax=Aspergillus bertholletiae TaxID=1226010 RepID=A0A5N7B201_9EURO|nr:hypothetical protein BDV26DRAFT_17705 [Aspergillus bertholletiae]
MAPTTHQEARIHRFCLGNVTLSGPRLALFVLVVALCVTVEMILPDGGGFLSIPNTNGWDSTEPAVTRRTAVSQSCSGVVFIFFICLFFFPCTECGERRQKSAQRGTKPLTGTKQCSADAFRAKTTPDPNTSSSAFREDTKPSHLAWPPPGLNLTICMSLVTASTGC